MRILTLEANPSYGGGCEAVSLAVSRGMAQRGHEVCLVYETSGTMLEEYETFVLATARFPLSALSRRAPFNGIAASLRIARFARAHRCSTLLTSHLGLRRTVALAGKLASIPVVLHLGFNGPALSRFDLMVDRSIRGVAPAAHTINSWRSSGWKNDQLFCVPNWVDCNRFKPAQDRVALRTELGLPLHDPLIVYVGRLVPEKGLLVLMRSLATIRQSLPRACAVVVGGYNQLAKEFQDLRNSLGLPAEAWIQPGITPTPEKYLAAGNVACVPSIWEEPHPLALLEAMATATPVVATTVGSLPSTLGDENQDLLVPPNDHEALAARLIQWLSDPERSEDRGRQLRQRVLRHYGPEAGLDAYERILLGHLRH